MRPLWHLGLGRDLALAFWALTLFEATIGAYASVWPLWIERLGAPITVVGLVLGLSGVIRPFILMPSSWLFDRFDPLKLLIGARVLSIGGLLIAALAQDWTILIVTVVLNALGEIVFATIHTFVADHSGENKVRAFSMVVTIGPATALIVMPIVSGLVIAQFGIRSAFVLAAITTVGALIFVAQMNFRRPRHDDGNTSVPSYREAISHHATRQILIVHGLTLICLSVGVSLIPNYLEDFRDVSPSVISILSAGAAVGTALFAVITARSRRLQSSPLTAAAIWPGDHGGVQSVAVHCRRLPLPRRAVFGLGALHLGGRRCNPGADSVARFHRTRDPRWRRDVVWPGALRATLQRRPAAPAGCWGCWRLGHGCDDPARRSPATPARPTGACDGVVTRLSARTRTTRRARATIASANCDGCCRIDPARFRMVFTHTEIA
jgi:MFS family permease